MTPFLWVLVGAWIGAPVGFFAAAPCQAAGATDDAAARAWKEINGTEEERTWLA